MKFLTCLLLVCSCTLAVSDSEQFDFDLERPFERELYTCDSAKYTPLVPTITDAVVTRLDWVGADDLHVFGITRRTADTTVGGLWRSADGGQTFTDLTKNLNKSLNAGESVDVIYIHAEKSRPGSLFLIGAGNHSWYTTDYGDTLTLFNNPNGFRGANIAAFHPHPWREDWLLILVLRPGCKPSEHTEYSCPYDLLLTQNAFSTSLTWLNLTANSNGQLAGFVDFDWGASLCKNHNCTGLQVSDNTILATAYKRLEDFDLPWDPDVHFISSDNLFKTYTTRVYCGNQFELVGRNIYLAYANSCPTDIMGNRRSIDGNNAKGITLYTSRDGGVTFDQACMPVALKQEGYELVETQDGLGAIAIVNFALKTPGGPDVLASNAYTAGPHHALFSLSLTAVSRPDLYDSSDFAVIQALPGVYIANQMFPRFDDYYFGGFLDTPVVETRITFNGGGHWQPIPAPLNFRNPRCDRCAGRTPCYLHLHGPSNWRDVQDVWKGILSFPAVYSSDSAPGIIMASGNVGLEEDGIGLDDNDGLCTWLSTDGGVSWHDVAEGAYIYEYADWGGVIVMAKHEYSGAADEVLFSMDYGRCWSHVPLQTALLVDNIRIEPDGQQPRVLVHGRACKQSVHPRCSYVDSAVPATTQGLVYLVDVVILMASRLPPCTPNDFSTWSMPSEHTNEPRCMLGQTMQFTRRKEESVCLQGAAYKRPPAVNTSCECTMEDVECEYGWSRDASSSCLPITRDKMPNCPDIQNNVYTASKSGLRMVHGDVCTGIDKIISDTNGQGKSTGGGSGGGGGKKKRSGWFGFLMFLLVTCVLAGLFTAWWKFLATEAHKDVCFDVLYVIVTFFQGLWGHVVDLFERCRGKKASESELNYFQPLGDAGVHDPEADHNLFTLR